ncbi:SNF2 family N-terminal domain-containing protein [Phascolomyces articulosus]|uniref:SNF2 family N-terminal domain-containing protein n=1 Tax=Phascolomyces articulosus TaxID=60185 RepID=A0AAD5JYY3_9FUNG|nr:SNF2 family N-terminal domain-containing protein [Phascolomyces articulosus]
MAGPFFPQANMAPGAFTKEKLNGLLQRAKFLQMQGANEHNNAELAQIMQFLKSLQQRQQKMGATVPSVPMTAPMGPNDGVSVASNESNLTPNQLTALRYQILAYKLISKNIPLPAHLQQAVLTSLGEQQQQQQELAGLSRPATATSTTTNVDSGPSTPASPAAAAGAGTAITSSIPTISTPGSGSATTTTIGSTPQPKLTEAPTATLESQLPPQQQYNAYASPYNLLKKPISSYAHASRQQRLLIPSITPTGMDPHSVITERERRIRTRIQYRIAELEKLPSNLMMNMPNTLTVATKENASSTKLKAVIELKALRLLSRQKRLRQEITGGMMRSTTLATSADRLSYRRMKKQSLREARMTEKVERQQRLDRDRREKQKQLDHLQMICDHGRNLVAAHKTWQSKQSKLGRAVIQYHQHVEKEEQKKAERLSKERIRALKADDEEAYMKLIDEAKDTRLTQLLRQTGMFLESLTRSVADQQADAATYSEMPTQEVEDDGDADSKQQADYFQVTHRIKEEVSQPTILVGGTLKEYQIKGLQWMVSLYNNHLNGILADEMGLGKTIQTISLITYLIEKKRQNGPYLIIVPLSTLTNWSLEFDKWAPSIRTVVYKGPPTARKILQQDIRQGDFQVLLTTFEYIIKDRPLLSKIRWLHMIIDEGHRMKNTNSKLVQVLRQYYHTKYRLILTGTPLQNNLPELWALLNFILPKIFKSVKSFEEWFNTPFNNQGVSDKVGLNEEEQLLIIKRLHKVLRPFLLRRLKKDVESELPDKVERVLKCRLSALQTKLYTQMKKSGILYTASGEKGRTGIKGLNNTIMQLRKICNHPFVFEEVENEINPQRSSNELLYRTSGKFELLDRMLPKLKQTGHRVLIFFQMTQIMTIMEDFLSWRGFQYLRLDGSTKADDRSELLHMFNAPESPYFVFLLSTRAGGLGLNLQAADTVIIFDSDWNPHQDLQAQDRAHRIGQTKEVRIFRLISANSIEENILARANYKLDIDGKVIQAGKFDNRSTEEDREAFLRSLLEDKSNEQDEEENDDIDDEELNEMLQRSDQELVTFAKIDVERRREEGEMKRRVGNRNKKYERLIQEDELPDIYRYDELPDEQLGPDIEYGRGQRSRDSVRYDDGLTEEQWLNALEDDNVDLDELIAKKEARRRKRLAKLQALQNEDEGSDSSGRGRKRRGGGGTASATEDEGSQKKRGRPKKLEEIVPDRRKKHKQITGAGEETLEPHIRKEMTHLFEECYKAVEESVEEDEDGTVRERIELFMDLVSKRDYPIYYKLIKKPISMNMIKKRIHSPYYKTIDQFRDDFKLMFDNARTFNEEGSIVYEDANEMEKIFNEKYEELFLNGDTLDLPRDINVPNMNGRR